MDDKNRVSTTPDWKYWKSPGILLMLLEKFITSCVIFVHLDVPVRCFVCAVIRTFYFFWLVCSNLSEIRTLLSVFSTALISVCILLNAVSSFLLVK